MAWTPARQVGEIEAAAPVFSEHARRFTNSFNPAVSVFSMCRLAILAIKDGNQSVITTLNRLFGDSALPRTAQELCHRVLHTVYMGMSKQSSRETRQRAKDLSEAIGSYHIDLDIDSVYHAQKNLVKSSLGLDAKFKVEGGSEAENLMLQNIQARTRMVVRQPTWSKTPSFVHILWLTHPSPTMAGCLRICSNPSNDP